jgi:phage/plasmid-associated DNA primase
MPYSNADQFIIDYISTWTEDILCKQICCTTLYQDYLTWCKKNNEQVLSSNILGKKFSQMNIDRKRV